MTYNDNNNLLTNGASQPESEIQINKIFAKAFYHWPLYVLVTLFALAFAWLYLRYTKPVFVSVAKIYIKDENKAGASRQTNALDAFALLSGNKLVENEMEIIKSPLILQDVIRENRFNIRYFEKGQFSDFEVYEKRPVEITIISDSAEVGNYFFDITKKKNSEIEVKYTDNTGRHVVDTHFNQPFKAGKDIFSFTYYPYNNQNNINGFKIKVDSITELAYVKSAELRTALLNNKASVFMMIYEDGIARRTADFLNAVAKKYNEYTLDDKNLTALNSIKFINGRLQSLGGELETIEKDVELFKTTRGITQIDESSRLYLDQAKEADQKLDEANIQLSVFDQIEHYINNNNDGTMSFTPVIGNVDAALTSIINRYQDLVSQKKRLSLSLQADNPLQQNIDQQISDVKNTIKNYITGYRQNAITTKSGLQRKVNLIEGLISKVPKYERDFINLKRQQSVKEALYLFLLQKKEETSVSYASNIVDNKIISPAYIPRTPIKPQKIVVVIVFILAGIVLTSIYILIKYLINTRVNSKKDIEKAISIPLIAEIFKEEPEKGKKFFDNKPRSVLSEQMLNLRSNLKFLLNDVKTTPTILLTSSISGEGKTFLSAHLGNSLTGNRKRVVLLELDLRKPKLAKSLEINSPTGITNYLVGDLSVDDIIRQVPNTNNLFLIPSGPIPPNPIELLEGEKIKELFELLKGRFDYIIVDTAPFGLVSDSKSLATYIDCALFVVRFNYTPKSKLAQVGENLTDTTFKKVGLIFNGIEQGGSYGYYNYGYSNYGYGYGYFGDESKKRVGLFLKEIKNRML